MGLLSVSLNEVLDNIRAKCGKEQKLYQNCGIAAVECFFKGYILFYKINRIIYRT